MSELLSTIKKLHEGKLTLNELDRETKHKLYVEFTGYDSVEQYLLDKEKITTSTNDITTNLNNKELRRATISRRNEKLPIECVQLRRAKRVPKKKCGNNENI